MTKIISCKTLAFILALTFVYTSTALAESNLVPAKAQSGKEVAVPEHAIEKAPGLYYLGESFDEDSGQMVEGYMIVHPRDGKAKGGKKGKPDNGTDPEPSSPTAACYGFIANGAKWKSIEGWEVDPTNIRSLDHNEVFNKLDYSIGKWEDATDGVLDGSGANVFGSGIINTSGDVAADQVSTDGRNEVMFGDLDAGTIGVTIVWGRFGGRPQSRQIVEWDQVYNEIDFDWDISETGTSSKMDFESIATHELGHAMGMADLYEANCSAMSMYGYGSEGQIHARSLEDGDINGINELY